VPLASRNHILLANDPAWRQFVVECRAFMAEGRARTGDALELARVGLSPRELEVLRLAATGRTNLEIGDALALSVRTVERHLSNAFDKLGVCGKAARVAAVARVVAHPGSDPGVVDPR